MQKLSAKETERIRELSEALGPARFRAVMTTSREAKIVEGKRLERWLAGGGRISEAEAERLKAVSANRQAIEHLAAKSEGKTKWKTNRALGDWLAGGKEKGIAPKTDEEKARQRRAARALGYLGVSPSAGTYYIRKATK